MSLFESMILKYKLLVIKNINYYIKNVGFPTMTINEFRNKHCGRGAVPPPPPYLQIGGELDSTGV